MQLNILEAADFAKQLAEDAGKITLSYYGRKFEIEHKDVINNLVTEADLAVEKFIIEAIQSKYPDHNLVTEENGNFSGNSDYFWFIDPIDGTTNFAHSYPMFAVSIALYKQNQGLIGVIHVPKLNETFVGIHGSGAFLNDKKIQVSAESSFELALVATGFPPDRSSPEFTQALKDFSKTQQTVHGIRRSGSACIDLAYLAAGRLDGFFEVGLNPWDTASGAVLITEAGGLVSAYNNEPFTPFAKTIIAGNPHIQPQLVEFIG